MLSIFGLSPNKIGGLETFAHELSTQLDDRGWRSVLCYESPPPDGVRRYLEQDNVSLEVMGRFYPGLTRLLRTHRPAILHLHLHTLFGPYALLARAFGVRRIYVTDHNSRAEGSVDRRLSLAKRAAFRCVMAPLTGVVCVSAYVQRSLAALGLLPRNRTTVIYNGVNTDRIETLSKTAPAFRAAHGIAPDAFLIVQVGQLAQYKGVPDLIEAVRLASLTNPRIRLLLVGEGADEPEYRALVERRGVAGHVIFGGYLEDPVADGVFGAADMLSAVSRWEEAFGLAIAEGMAAAKPVLATRVGGIPEIVSDGVTGFVVARGDTEAMAERILRLASDPALGARLGQAGQAVCRERFDLRRNVRQLLDLYGIDGKGTSSLDGSKVARSSTIATRSA